MIDIPVTNFFFNATSRSRGIGIQPKIPVLCIRADGLEAMASQCYVEDNCNLL